MSAGRPRTVIAILAGVLLAAAGAVLSAGTSLAAGSGAVTLPDLKILVPKDLISIGVDSSTGARQLRFTHITADLGAGPFEIDPTYNGMGTATFVQVIYRSPSPGQWVRDHTVPVAATGNWNPPSDYNFPLTRFTLNRANPDGSPGAVVAVSPKTDYCITADARVGGVPNTPDQTFIPASNCTDPNAALGWSVGWGDQYDQTDAGQPIDLAGVADGTYVLHAIVDPRHLFTESDTANNVTDTLLRISGDSVTVLSQHNPGAVTPVVKLLRPAGGSRVSGVVTLSASAVAHPPARITSVQFLLDGRSLGPVLHRAPYSYRWTVGTTSPGTHQLSARASDSAGNLATAPPIQVVVPHPPSLKVTSLRWHRGMLTLAVTGVPPAAALRAELIFAGGRSRSLTVRGGRLRLRSARPQLIILRLFAGGRRLGTALRVPLNAAPTVRIVNPVRGRTVSGVVPVSVQAADAVGISSVQLSADGKRLGPPLTAPPYMIRWDTRRVHGGRHRLSARATNVVGNSATVTLIVTVRNPAPPMTCFVLQTRTSAHGHGSASTAAIHTAMPGETLLAFVGGDGPAGPNDQSATVTGGGLRWRLARRANGSSGDSEIWTATATRVLTAATITARLSNPGYDEWLTVIAMEGTDGVGASAAASAPSGAPNLRLRTRSGTSLVFAVGNDWDRAVARRLPLGWVSLSQWLDHATGDTYWSQYTNQPTGAAGTIVDVGVRAPSTDQWNMAAVELVGSGA